jgi:hypothetical protein
MTERLPHLLAELVDAAGLTRVLAFARECGGTRMSVPKQARDGHRLVELLGRAGADKLCAMYGGEMILVPQGPAGTLAEARRRLARALDDGASINGAARVSGLHHRTAQRMRAKLKGSSNDPQGSLF